MYRKIAATICLASLSGCLSSSEVDQETHTKIVKNRVWVNMDDASNDHVSAFALMNNQAVYIEAWPYRVEQEVFMWKFHDNDYSFHWLHRNIDETPSIKAWECEEMGFELCLTITSDQLQNENYYSLWDLTAENKNLAFEKVLSKLGR